MVQEGHTRYVGVSNVGAQQVRSIHQRLKHAHGIQLFSNQVEFSLLVPGIAKDGTLSECQRLGVKILAYCPLAMGRLTGKYSADNEPQFFGYGSKSYRYHGALPWPHIEKVLGVCKGIASQRNASITQVALNWCIAQGTIPIPGAKTAAQALDNCTTLTWKLDSVDLAKLSSVAMGDTPAQKVDSHRSKGKGKGGRLLR
jgi:pyridoxine 4-dehydrogenase